jgi:PAS domain S-box-containing protein
MAYPSKAKRIVRPAASVALRYGLALVSVAIAQGLAHTFLYFHLPQPLTAFALCAIAITFRYGGTEPGILAALLAALIRSYVFEPEVNTVARILYDLVFLVFTMLMIHFTRERKELEARVAERTAELTRANEDLKLEIVERKRAEEEVNGAENRLRLVLDTTPALINSARPDGHVDYFNKRGLEFVGLPLEAVQGWGWNTVIHSEDVEEIVDKWRVALASGEPLEAEARMRRADGEYRWRLFRQVPLRDEDGNIVRWYGSSIDIEDRKRAEETLRLREERYRLIVENQTEFIVKWLPDGTRTFVNDNYCRMFGIAEADCLGTSFYPLVAPEFREEIKRKVTDLTPSKPDFTEEHQSSLPDGQHWQQWMTRGIFDAGGNLVELISAGRDITQLKQTEEELRRARERIESILNGVSDTFILFDRQWRYLYLNDAAVRATGRPLEEILGRTLWELFPEVVGTKLDSQFHRSMDEGVNIEFDFHFLSPGVDQWWEIRTYPQRGGGLAVFATDTTERKRADDQLRRLSGELLRSQDEERRKIARDLHDSMGQDLVALATMMGQLRASVPSASRKSSRLLSECKALADKCIRDVRTLSYVLHPPVLDESGLGEAIREYVGGFTKRSGIQVELELSPRVGRMTPDVELALFRVVQESLANIQRHTGSQRAKIQIHRNAHLTLEISDHGSGASAIGQRGKGKPGFESGVGIPSMEERVKLIGGSFEIHSTSHGTIVRVTIPLKENEREKAAHSAG